MKKLVSACLIMLLAMSFLAPPASAVGYIDVPSGSSLKEEIQKANVYGLMNGYTTTVFGYGDSMTRVQFVTVLDRMLGWSVSNHGTHIAMWMIPETMGVPSALSETYLSAIEQAVQRDVIDSDVKFRPSDAITRAEMSEMLVRALGLKSAAVLAAKTALPFTDVSGSEKGYVAVAYRIGMTKGMTASSFAPKESATRAQAAAMLVRIYEKLHPSVATSMHGFYAISSYSQIDLTKQMDAVSVGWSRMTWDGTTALLSTTSANGNEYAVPNGYTDAVETIQKNGASLHLSVFMDASGGVRDLLASQSGRDQAVEQIMNELTVSYQALGRNPYDGVTIDFEGLRSAQKENFTVFLNALSQEVHANNQSLYVCVSPVLATGSYYDGYDYQTIAELADRVILMAYDYDTRDLSEFVGTEYYRTAAPAPIDQIYWSLQALPETDISEFMLGFSFKNVAWQIDAFGKLVSGTPVYPSAETVQRRLAQSDTELGWSAVYQMPYAVYTTESGERYFLWYENSRSLQAKTDLANLMGLAGVSVWRLGLVPDDVF